MNKKLKTVFIILGTVLLTGTIILGVYLVQQSQEIRSKASTPSGQATALLAPTSADKQVGETIPVQLSFNTNNVAISAISIRLTYSYSETQPPLVVQDNQITVNPVLLASGDWTCPIKTTSSSGGKYLIDISCLNTNVAGYTNNSTTLFASFNLLANAVPSVNPAVLTFDPQQSIITTKVGGTDTLLNTLNSGSYTVGGGAPTASPSPTSAPGERTPTPTTPTSPTTPISPTPPIPTTTSSSTSTGTSSSSPTPTLASLPVTSAFSPTLIFILLGMISLTLGGVFLRKQFGKI